MIPGFALQLAFTHHDSASTDTLISSSSPAVVSFITESIPRVMSKISHQFYSQERASKELALGL